MGKAKQNLLNAVNKGIQDKFKEKMGHTKIIAFSDNEVMIERLRALRAKWILCEVLCTTSTTGG